MFYPFYFQGDVDSGLNQLWQKKKSEIKQ